MVRNQERYEQAINLRKRGFTLQEIAKYCDISKSTASEWLKNKAFSADITKKNVKRAGAENAKRLQLINKARTAERANRYKEVLRSADVEFKHYQDNPLFIAGIMLYIGVGDNRQKRLVRMAGARMEVHQVFIRFAVEFLGVEKKDIHFWILLYPDHSEEACMKKWQKATGLPYAQFYKNQVILGKSNNQTLQYGIGNTIIGSTALKLKLNRWIELTMKKLTK